MSLDIKSILADSWGEPPGGRREQRALGWGAVRLAAGGPSCPPVGKGRWDSAGGAQARPEGLEFRPHGNNEPDGQLFHSQKPESAQETETIKQYQLITFKNSLRFNWDLSYHQHAGTKSAVQPWLRKLGVLDLWRKASSRQSPQLSLLP